MSAPELSVVIPAYNEATVIEPTLHRVVEFLEANGVTWELIVVDDGSVDGTAQVVEQVAKQHAGVRVCAAPHQGKGGAVRRGVMEAQGRYVLFMDADYSTPIEEWRQCAPWLRDGYDIVIGSRKMPGATITRHQPRLREWMGKGFTWLTNLLVGAQVSDITCGFKCFRHEVAKELARWQRINGWAFDAEWLFLARRHGYRIKEVPVTWTHDDTTNVRLARDVWQSLRELIAMRLGALKGWYPT